MRDRAAVLADRERLRQAAQLEPDAGRRLLDLQLEGIREAPLGRRRLLRPAHRAPRACSAGPPSRTPTCGAARAAIQNLWLAARAEGLGMGWVTLFRPEELAELLGLPDGVVTLGWLCLGWPDERPPAPGLERAGWSRRAPLADVVLRRPLAGDDADAGRAAVAPAARPAPAGAVVGARDDADRLLTAPGLARRARPGGGPRGRPGSRRRRPRGVLVLAAADHPVAGTRRHGLPARR